jgi:hypothetical protein
MVAPSPVKVTIINDIYKERLEMVPAPDYMSATNRNNISTIVDYSSKCNDLPKSFIILYYKGEENVFENSPSSTKIILCCIISNIK